MLDELIEEIENLQRNTAVLAVLIHTLGGKATITRADFDEAARLNIGLSIKQDKQRNIIVSVEQELLN